MANLNDATRSPLDFVTREALAAVVAFFQPVNDAWTRVRDGIGAAALFSLKAAGPPDLSGANLEGAHLDKANLEEAHLVMTNLLGARLYGANLYEANLYAANLSRANLNMANLSRANLKGANLRDAIISRSALHEAIIVDDGSEDAMSPAEHT